jgi:hypothetical protein
VGRRCAGRAASSVSSYVAPAWWSSGGGGVLLTRLLLLLFSSLRSSSSSSSPLLVRWRRKGEQTERWLGFGGAASRYLRGGSRVAARARTPRAAMPGVRATATQRASDCCGAGLGFAARAAGARAAGARGKRGACVRAVTGVVAERGGARAGG